MASLVFYCQHCSQSSFTFARPWLFTESVAFQSPGSLMPDLASAMIRRLTPNAKSLSSKPRRCNDALCSYSALVSLESPACFHVARIILSCREPENGALSMYKFRSRIKGRGMTAGVMMLRPDVTLGRHDYGSSFQQMYDTWSRGCPGS